MSDSQPYDDRHNTPPRGYTYDPAFAMPTAKAPPKEPATPPARDPEAPRPIDEARQERNERADAQRQQEIRSEAVSLAAQLYLVPASEGLVLPVNVFDLADEITAYIKDGTKP